MRSMKLCIMGKLQPLAGGHSGCQARKIWIVLWHVSGFSVLYFCCFCLVNFVAVLGYMNPLDLVSVLWVLHEPFRFSFNSLSLLFLCVDVVCFNRCYWQVLLQLFSGSTLLIWMPPRTLFSLLDSLPSMWVVQYTCLLSHVFMFLQILHREGVNDEIELGTQKIRRLFLITLYKCI